MRFNLKQFRRSRAGHALALMAMASLIFLLQPYCGFVDTAEAAPAVHQGNPLVHPQKSDHATEGDACPSLDHTPVVLPETGLPPVVDASSKLPLAPTADLGEFGSVGPSEVTPTATPPPSEPFPLYLRYAHLLI